MKMRLALAALLLTSTSAFAADLAPQSVEPAAPVAVAPVFSWTGFYAGVHVGADFGQSKLSVAGFGDTKFNSTGFLGGGHVGYNEQFDGGFVVGIETDIDYSSLSKTKNLVVGGDPVTAKFKNEWQGSTRARFGYAIDNLLPYVTGGVAYGNQKYSVVAPGLSASISDTRVGWTAGAGVEYAIDQNWLVRGEVRYTDFGKDTTNVLGVPVKTRFDSTSATLGASYKF
jgi:outer membrane immunogenic protein